MAARQDIKFFSGIDQRTSPEARRRDALAEMLAKSSQPTPNEMVGGYVVPKSSGENLAKALGMAFSGYQAGQAEKAEQERRDSARNTLASAMEAYNKSQMGGPEQLPSGETINWNAQDPRNAGRMYANLLMQNEDTAPIGMQTQMGQMQAQQNMANELDMYRQKFPLELELARAKAQIESQFRAPPASIQEWEYGKENPDFLKANAAGAGGSKVWEDAQNLVNASVAAGQPMDLMTAYGIAKSGMGVGRTFDAGTVTAIPGAVETARTFESAGKPMPATIVQAQDDLVDKINISQGISTKMQTFKNQIDKGELDLGLMANLENKARNNLSMSTQESANLASFQATLENLRNESLRLNTGVQTDGDAQRAWGELVANINDPRVVRQRLDEIDKINQRGAQLQKQRLDLMRSEYGRGALNLGGQPTTNPAINTPVDQIQPAMDAGQMGGGQSLSFNTPEEAEAANLPPGTVVIINGRRAVVE